MGRVSLVPYKQRRCFYNLHADGFGSSPFLGVMGTTGLEQGLNLLVSGSQMGPPTSGVAVLALGDPVLIRRTKAGLS